MNRLPVTLAFNCTAGRQVAPPSIESWMRITSLLAAVFEAYDTKMWFALLVSTATIGLARVLPSLQRSSPGRLEQSTAVMVATVRGKPVCCCRPLAHEL